MIPDAPTLGRYRGLLAPLMEHPGEWHIAADYPSARAGYIRASKLRRHRNLTPEGAWEFRGHHRGDGTSVLYARYLGAVQLPPPAPLPPAPPYRPGPRVRLVALHVSDGRSFT